MDRLAPPEKVFVGDCKRVENYQHRVVGPVGVDGRTVQRGPLRNQRVER